MRDFHLQDYASQKHLVDTLVEQEAEAGWKSQGSLRIGFLSSTFVHLVCRRLQDTLDMPEILMVPPIPNRL